MSGTRRDGALRVLVVDRMPPTSLTQGNALIGRHLFHRLAHHHLSLVAPVRPDERAAVEALLADSFEAVELVDAPEPPTAIVGWIDASLPRVRRRPAVRGIAEAIARIGAAGSFDVVHVRQLPMAPFGPRVRATGRLLELIDSETLATRRDPRSDARARVRRQVAREVERRAMRGYDVVTAVAAADADALRSLAPAGTSVDVVPNGVDASVFAPLEIPETPDELVFVGAMSFPPNVAAVRWFAREVLPRVRRDRPDVVFRIVGRDPVPEVAALGAQPGIEVTGPVHDVRPYLARAAVVVCPMVSGSGIKNKALEALSMARPLAVTPLALEGIDAVPDRDLVVGASAAELATGILGLLADGGRRAVLGANGRRLVEDHYSWDACAARYDELYRRLAQVRHSRLGAPTFRPASEDLPVRR